MGKNPFFNNYNNTSEQSLINALVAESVAIYGHTIYYIPRTIVKKDDIYGEDSLSTYRTPYEIDVFIKSFEGYEGDGTFLSKFNIQIRDQIKFTISVKTFDEEIARFEEMERPREGDLIYSKMMKRLFIIQYVNNKPVFYQFGDLQMYDITCEVFEYSNEIIDTGVDEIDSIQYRYSFDEDTSTILTDDGLRIVDSNGFSLVSGDMTYEDQMMDVLADNDELKQEAEAKQTIDWSETNPFGDPI